MACACKGGSAAARKQVSRVKQVVKKPVRTTPSGLQRPVKKRIIMKRRAF